MSEFEKAILTSLAVARANQKVLLETVRGQEAAWSLCSAGYAEFAGEGFGGEQFFRITDAGRKARELPQMVDTVDA